MTALATAVGQVLAAEGVRCAFGVVGAGNILSVAGLTAAGVRYVAARHEGGAIAMADAYHRVSGDVAVCTTTHGPGFTNVATGLGEAAKHGSGVLVLCGYAPVLGSRRFDIDQHGLATAVGAQVRRIADPATAVATTRDALRLARECQRPVVLGVPGDLLAAEVPDIAELPRTAELPLASQTPRVAPDAPRGAEKPRTTESPVATAAPLRPSPPDRRRPAAAELDAALDLLAGARRPLLVAGLGAWRSGAAGPIARLADRLGGLLATTVMANGLFADHAWSIGVMGGFSSPAAAELIRTADVIVAFGATLDDFTLHHGMLLDPSVTVVQVDLAPGAPRADLAVTADAATAATELLDAADARRLPQTAWRQEVTGQVGRAGRPWPHVDASTTDRIDPRTLSARLAQVLPAERVLVLDGGHFISWPVTYWPVANPASFAFMGSAFQVIGLGFAGGVGAAAARPGHTVVVAAGDGGSLMGLSELETLIRETESSIVVIYDDGGYGYETNMYLPQGADRRTTQFGDTDFAGVARALGASAVTVRTVADLAAVKQWCAQGRCGTLVLDCKVVPDVVATFLSDLIALRS